MIVRAHDLIAAGLALALNVATLSIEARAEPIELSASRIPLYPSRPDDNRAGVLLYRGGLVLNSSDARFGGWSDLAVSTDGERLLAISDRGHWLRARLSHDPSGNLASASSADIAPILDRSGRPLRGRNGDAEGLALEREGDLDGPVAVSFEGNVRIWRYDLAAGLGARPTNIPIGNWVRALHPNAQLEAIALVKPDTLIAFGEAKPNEGDDLLGAMEAYPGGELPMTRMLSVVPHEPFRITGAARAPDEGIFLLERRFSLLGGVGTELRHIGANDIREGARLDGRVLMDLSFQDANIDNMEGVAVRRTERGETFLYLISDNNFSKLQRTLLLMFEVKG